VDPRLDQAPVVAAFAARLRSATGLPRLTGLYVGGSLASGDYRPAVSDLDVVALLERRPDPGQRRRLVDVHTALLGRHPSAASLHCAYLPVPGLDDVGRRHWTWAFGELFRRPVSGVARAELLADPVVVHGPRPAELLAPMGVADLRTASREELAGYWARAVRRRSIWLQDVYVDQGLVTLARVEATLSEGRLVTKREAISRLDRVGVGPLLADQVARRRDGEQVVLSDAERRERAVVVRRLMTEGVTRLAGLP
jgi:hypothetical protein